MTLVDTLKYFEEEAAKDAKLAALEYKEVNPPVRLTSFPAAATEAELSAWDAVRSEAMEHNQKVYEARCRLRKHYHYISGAWFGSPAVQRDVKAFLNKRDLYAVRMPRAPRDMRKESADAIAKKKAADEKATADRLAKEAASGKADRAINFLLERGKKLGVDFTAMDAVFIASDIAESEEVARRMKAQEWHTFSGDDNCEDCSGWDGTSRRCDCGNRRVSWTRDGDFETLWVYAEAY